MSDRRTLNIGDEFASYADFDAARKRHEYDNHTNLVTENSESLKKSIIKRITAADVANVAKLFTKQMTLLRSKTKWRKFKDQKLSM